MALVTPARAAPAAATMQRRPPSLLLRHAPPTSAVPLPTALTRRRQLVPLRASPRNKTATTTTAASDEDNNDNADDGRGGADSDGGSGSDGIGGGPRLIHASLAARPALCDGGLPDPEMCLLDGDDAEMRAEDLVIAAEMAAAAAPAEQETLTAPAPLPPPLLVPPAPDGSVLDEAASRGRWLVGLLVVQSLSSVVLERFEPLIREHLTITLFLTMLVGAGGNAGNQSAIKVVRSLATGQLDASWASARAALARQAAVAVALGGGLAAAGYVRVIAAAAMGGLGSAAADVAAAAGGAGAAASSVASWADASRDAAAIAVSLLAIVVSSVLLGTALPFALARMGLDAAHSGTTIQVASDVLGVLVTCLACSFFYSGALDGLTDGIGAALAWVF